MPHSYFSVPDAFFLNSDGLVYWSREEIETNARVYENNQRNLLQPKFESKWDAHAVEATSYALLVAKFFLCLTNILWIFFFIYLPIHKTERKSVTYVNILFWYLSFVLPVFFALG